MNEKTNICIVSFARLGDTVCKLPALWALRDAYPKARICLVSQYEREGTFVTSKDVLEGAGLVDSFEQLVVYGSRVKKWLNRAKLILRMRRIRWHLGLVLMPSYPPADVAIFNALERYLLYFDCLKIHRPTAESPFHWTKGRLDRLPHVADNMLETIASAGISVPLPGEGRFVMPARPVEAAWAKAFMSKTDLTDVKDFVAVSLGANMPANVWPAERYASVLTYLWRTYKVAPIFFGPASSKIETEALMAALPVKILCAGETIGRVAELMRNCNFYLGNDTGLMHLAVSVGLKCVMVSGARNAPGMWEPYGPGHEVLRAAVECEGCLRENCVERKKECLMRISVEEVQKAADKVYKSR